MSFYLNMLREEEDMLNGNTGFDPDAVATPDDKYAIELDNVAQTVKDLNTARAEESSDEELDGQDLHEDPVAECMIAIYESDHNWNVIMQTIGTRELSEAVRGREMVMEAVDVKGFFEKAKQFFVNLFKKITGIIKNWIGNASAAFRTNKSFVQKYGKKLAEGQRAYEADPKNKQFKGYDFKDTKGVVEFVKANELANANMLKVVNSLTSQINSGTDSYSAVASLKGDAGEFRAKLCGMGSGSVDAGEFRKKLKAAYYGGDEPKTLSGDTVSAKHLIDVLSTDNKDIQDIKKAYSTMKKGFDDTLKALRSLESAISKSGEKGNYGEARSNAMTAVSAYIQTNKDMKNAGSLSLTTMLKAIRAEKAQCRKIANAYIFALNKSDRKASENKDKKPVGEGGFLSGIELI